MCMCVSLDVGYGESLSLPVVFDKNAGSRT